MMRILFLGDTWDGSCARSLREALAIQPELTVSDIGLDSVFPNYSHLALRIANRLLRGFQMKELESVVLSAIRGFPPDAVVVYKGAGVGPGLLNEIRRLNIPLVNVFPDYSPHAYGHQLQEAMGCYDLVISTKPFHPRLWLSLYGYRNPCVCVPHGYDPKVHYWEHPALSYAYDVALCCNWRPEYHRLMCAFSEALGDDKVSVAVAGPGWSEHLDQLPRHWHYSGAITGRAYGEFLRSAKIVIAPINREVIIRGASQPGDEDTSRTYQLAAAHCFFLHQRTDFVATVYDEQTEVPFWSDAVELSKLVKRWLPDETGRRSMAAKAQKRAVPAYSDTQRAASILAHIEQLIKERKGSRRAA